MSEPTALEHVLELINRLTPEDQERLCVILEVKYSVPATPDQATASEILAATRRLNDVTVEFNNAFQESSRLASEKMKAEKALSECLKKAAETVEPSAENNNA